MGLQNTTVDGHQVSCNWIMTTNVQCEYRSTHRYCPHPDHACDCGRIPTQETKT